MNSLFSSFGLMSFALTRNLYLKIMAALLFSVYMSKGGFVGVSNTIAYLCFSSLQEQSPVHL
jgi:hypothetical protein